MTMIMIRITTMIMIRKWISMDLEEVMEELNKLSDPEAIKGMTRFGISSENNLGISVHVLRKMAKDLGKDHPLALELWGTGIHDARMLACLLSDPDAVTEEQMESWVMDFNSWDVCDVCCNHLFRSTSYAYRKAYGWAARDEVFVKRAGFVLMACLSVHDKAADDTTISEFFPVIVRESGDERNYVKKAVNWALRQIGKRNLELNRRAINVAQEIERSGTQSGRWIARDALQELTSDKIQERLKKKDQKQREQNERLRLVEKKQ